MEKISMLNLTACVCEVIDLVSNAIKNHHNMVAWGAYHLTEAMGITGDERRNIVIAAAIHDMGGLSLNDRLMAVALDFEDSNNHAEKGYRLLSGFKPFQDIANIVRNHHTPWDYGNAVDADGNPIHIGSQIILLADRISVMLKPDINVLNQTNGITKSIIRQENTVYEPGLIEAFKSVADKESFWLDMMTQDYRTCRDRLSQYDTVLTGDDLTDALELISKIIDFRSSFTASHSRGVSAVACKLSSLMSFSEADCNLMRAAGLLHDIGKLAVPSEIIDKPAVLNGGEKNVLHCHTYYTEMVLSHLGGLDSLKEWASYHHENLDGSGYPYRLGSKELSLGSRIMKVADVFVALMEDRPYRNGMGLDKTLSVLNKMVAKREVDPGVVSVLCDNAEEISGIWHEEYIRSLEYYRDFIKGLED